MELHALQLRKGENDTARVPSVLSVPLTSENWRRDHHFHVAIRATKQGQHLCPHLFKDSECWCGRDSNLRPPALSYFSIAAGVRKGVRLVKHKRGEETLTCLTQ